jgi:hypothetical protein
MSPGRPDFAAAHSLLSSMLLAGALGALGRAPIERNQNPAKPCGLL